MPPAKMNAHPIHSQFGVFLSSTNQSSVQAYRHAARDVLKTKEFAHLWKPIEMDGFSPNDSPSVDECKRLVEQCAVYVGILGPFYGSVIKEDDDDLNISYTEYEYTVASDSSKKIAIFTLPPEAVMAQTMRDELRYFKEQAKLFARQDAFIERLNNLYTTRSVEDVDDFREKFSTYVREELATFRQEILRGASEWPIVVQPSALSVPASDVPYDL